MTFDSNDEIWKSADGVQAYVAGQERRELQRRAQWQLMAELLPFGEDEAFTVLDIGAGTGPAARAVLEAFPNCKAILADFSSEMMNESTTVMAPYDGRYTYVTFDMTNNQWPSSIPVDLGAVVTSQCVHHINDLRKQQLFIEIYDHLRAGGWYLNFDPVVTEDSLIDAAWRRANTRQDPQAAEHDLHRTPGEQIRYENHVRYMAPLEPQLDYMHAAGFEALDVYWKNLDFVVYGGSKPLE